MFDPQVTPYGSLWRAAFAVAVYDLQRETGDQRQLTREWLHEMLSKFGALDATALLARWLDRNDLAARDRLRKMFATSHATPYKTGTIDPAALDDGERAEQHRRRGKESAIRHAERVSAGVAAERLANGLDLAAKRTAAPPATPRTAPATTGRKEAAPFLFYRSLGDSKRAAAASTVPRPEPQRVKPAKPTKPAKPKRAETRPATLTKRAEAAIRKLDRQRKRMGEAHARRWRRMTPEERSARRARMSEAQRASWAKLDDGGRAARVAAIAAGRERKRIARLERVAALRAEAMAAFSRQSAGTAEAHAASPRSH